MCGEGRCFEITLMSSFAFQCVVAAPTMGVLCARGLILWGCLSLEGAQAVHEGKSKYHGCVRHGEKYAFLASGKGWGVYVRHILHLQSQWG